MNNIIKTLTSWGATFLIVPIHILSWWIYSLPLGASWNKIIVPAAGEFQINLPQIGTKYWVAVTAVFVIINFTFRPKTVRKHGKAAFLFILERLFNLVTLYLAILLFGYLFF